MLRQRKTWAFLAVTALGLLVDQGTKSWIVANVALQAGEIELIPGFLALVHERNDGMAFSLLRGWFPVFVAFTAFALWMLADMWRRLEPDAVWTAATLGLLLSGALGNLVDRLRFQYVVDWIRVTADHPAIRDRVVDVMGSYTYPIFNIADIAIVVGVVLILFLGSSLEPARSTSLNAPTPDPT